MYYTNQNYTQENQIFENNLGYVTESEKPRSSSKKKFIIIALLTLTFLAVCAIVLGLIPLYLGVLNF
jgi:hypothetical protein